MQEPSRCYIFGTTSYNILTQGVVVHAPRHQRWARVYAERDFYQIDASMEFYVEGLRGSRSKTMKPQVGDRGAVSSTQTLGNRRLPTSQAADSIRIKRPKLREPAFPPEAPQSRPMPINACQLCPPGCYEVDPLRFPVAVL